MSDVETVTVAEAEAGMRLDRWFRARYPGLGHGALEKLLRTGQVRVDGARVKAGRRVEPGETVRVPPAARAAPTTRPAPAPPRVDAADARYLRSLILFEDDDIVAITKPAGLPVQGGAGARRHVDGLLATLAAGGERPRLVHRLDRDTSGVLVAAKTRGAAARLAAAFRGRDVEKTYWALCAAPGGWAPRPRGGTIDLKVAKRGGAGAERMTPAEGEDAKIAITEFQLVEAAGPVAFVALKPVTGRTHQLRVHCAAIEAPIVGDRKYGGRAARIDGVGEGLHLFCRSMRLAHPRTGAPLTLTAPLSGEMRRTWSFFGFDAEARVDWPETPPPRRRKSP